MKDGWSEADVEEILSGLEPSPPPSVAPTTRKQPLRFPLAAAQRIAVLKPGFGEAPNTREFSAADIEGVRRYRPDSLVAPLNTALLLAEQILRGALDYPTLTIAVAVVTRIGDAALAAHHRELIWAAFQVPVFEILLGWDGTVIARECEVHDGLHVETGVVIPAVRGGELVLTHINDVEQPIVLGRTGYSGDVVRVPCECGSGTPRLVGLGAMVSEQVDLALKMRIP